ncbi:hypothetical protein CTAYLR_003525 [Chrysophaeum taylorii]|uniref:AB hydrolase-1 domain-containing protein n=1 Tax=Chrysophaeum taylorii TaxID=2483200 RepID=A0AAD7XL53_9STRA|nr:hypothetical protein CTAYLR_003525 [Chrysophaeum taylorii]
MMLVAKTQALKTPYLTYGKLGVRENAGALCLGAGAALAGPRRLRLCLGASTAIVVREALREMFHAPAWTATMPAVGEYVGPVHTVSWGSEGVLLHASHGFGSNALSFDALMRLLPVRGVAHDQPGFGLTRRPEGLRGYFLDGDLAAATGATVFLGHSMGAIAALDAGIRKNVTAVVLVAPALTPRGVRLPRWLRVPLARLGAAWPFALPTRFILRRVVHSSERFWPTSLGLCWSATSRRQNQAALNKTAQAYALPSRLKGWDKGLVNFAAARILAPDDDKRLIRRATELPRILIIHGDQDPVIPLANSNRLHALLPNSKIITLRDVGHCPHEEAPEATAAAIRDFLDLP